LLISKSETAPAGVSSLFYVGEILILQSFLPYFFTNEEFNPRIEKWNFSRSQVERI